MRPALLAIALAAAPMAAHATPPARRQAPREADAVAPQADQILHRMSDYMASLHSFRVRTDAVDEVVLPSGQRLQQVSASRVSVRRPDGLRSDRVGAVADLTFQYDGRTFALVGNRTGYYATAPAPPTIDDAVDAARARLGIDAPGADLLMSNPYGVLMQDTRSGMYVGLEPIDGTPCHHLAFRGAEVDWQIWVQDGPQPLPRRYVITSRVVRGEPEFAVQLSQWEPQAPLSADTFRFAPPSGGTQVRFLNPTVGVGETRRGGGP